MIARLTVAGARSSDGATMCALITACTPAAIAASKGWSAPARGSAPTTGSAMCESTDVSPWPGKCLTHAATPGAFLWKPEWLPAIEFPWRITFGTIVTFAVAICFRTP